jgi:YD repeat-containing protein
VLNVSYDGGGLLYTQSFTYDSSNRIDTANEVTDGTPQWTQNHEYDRYGNRWQVVGGNPSLVFNAANNRITSPGYSYDLAGNLTAEPDAFGSLKHSYAYDAENHIKTVGGAASYVYDGEGQRVRKLQGENLLLMYGMDGELLAEFDPVSGDLKKEYIYGASGLAATIASGEGTRYVTADHLGSPRILTSASGGVISRHDYEPFGEEIAASYGLNHFCRIWFKIRSCPYLSVPPRQLRFGSGHYGNPLWPKIQMKVRSASTCLTLMIWHSMLSHATGS